jgi:hypothetical protein
MEADMRKEYISPDATALELQSRGIVCQSLFVNSVVNDTYTVDAEEFEW